MFYVFVYFYRGPCVALLIRRTEAFKVLGEVFEHLDDLYYSLHPYTALRDQHLFFRQGMFCFKKHLFFSFTIHLYFLFYLNNLLFTPVCLEHVLERSVAILKPGFTGSTQEAVFSAFAQKGFVPIAQQNKTFTQAEAAQIFPDAEDEVKHLTSGNSLVIVVEKLGAVIDLLLLAGPVDPARAKQIAPASLRAAHGTDLIHNLLYVSTSVSQALKDAELLFSAPFASEHTVAIVQPDAYRFSTEIEATLTRNGFSVLMKEEVYLSLQRAEEFYSQNGQDSEGSPRATHLSSGAALVFLLYKPAAVAALNQVVGPTDPAKARETAPSSLRALYGESNVFNGFYASPNLNQAEKDKNFFFPQLLRPEIPAVEEVKTIIRSRPKASTGAAVSLHEVLVEGLTHLCQLKPTGLDAVSELANWLLRNNPNQPQVEVPTEAEPVIDLAEENTLPSDLDVSCVFGACSHQMVAQLCVDFDYEIISVSGLLEGATSSGSELGRALKATLALGRAAPAHIVMTLLRSAIIKAKKSRFLLTDFPLTLDLALAFEESIGELQLLVYFEASEEYLTKRFQAAEPASFAKLSRAEQKEILSFKVKSSLEDLEPVLEHYTAFGKLRSVNAESNESDPASLWAQLSTLFTVKAAEIPQQEEEMPLPPRREIVKPKLDDDD